MGLFSRKVRENDYDTGSYRENGRMYLPQEKGWYTCVLCGKKIRWKDVDVDHIQPKSKGGSNDAYNLQVMCKHRNRSKGNKTENTKSDLKRRKKEMDFATKEVEKTKRKMVSDAKRDARRSMSKKEYRDAWGKTYANRRDMDKAINGSDKEFDDFINSL